MNKKSWCCCLGPGGRTEKDWLPLTISYLYRFSLWMSPLPRTEMMQFCMGQSKEFFILTVTVRGWYCSALSGICRRTQHMEKGQGCRATDMPSSNPSRLCHPEPACSRGFFALPPIFLQVHSLVPHHTWFLWLFSLFRSLGDICIVFGSQFRLVPVVSVPYPLL